MMTITARSTVTPDGTISGRAPAQVPAGEHDVRIDVPLQPADLPATTSFDVNDMPIHDMGSWPAGRTFNREEFHGDDGP